ncbi:MAG: formate dehydrogenase subunit gamma [Betaproteobacteria bacterium]
MKLLAVVSMAAAALACGAVFAQAGPEKVQQQRAVEQPGNNAPVWRQVQSGEPSATSISGRETGVLIQPPARYIGQDVRTTAGEAWRQFRNGPVTFYGGWLVVLVALAILAFYSARGPVKLHGQPSGRLLRRFSSIEQLVHWSTAASFCVLALSGLAMLFGKHVLLPLVGYAAFGWLAAVSKNLHNFVAPLFIVSVAAMVLLFIRDNFPRRYDLRWLLRAWAVMARGEHVPSGRFNAGEKVWFWLGVAGLSVAVSWSGLVLLFPNFDQTRAVMQDAWVVHASAALLYIAISLGHIYLGTIGLEGSYQAMRSGYVDETWAKEHHEYWYDEIKDSSTTRRFDGPGHVQSQHP